jgi:lipoprotein-releasing system permease protein
MFHPLPIFVGLRYVRARSHKFFVSFITWASLLGVCVGVAALIVILSVMNGFESELRDSLLSLSAHARVVARGSAAGLPTAAQWDAAERAIRSLSAVAGVAPYVEIQALAVRTPEMLPVILRGIDANAEPKVTQLKGTITRGHLSDLRTGSGNVLLGAVVAERLGLAAGDELTLLIPTVGPDGTPEPKLRQLTVAGTFEVGSPEPDSTLVFAPIEDVRTLGSAGRSGEGLRVKLKDALAAPSVAEGLARLLPPTLTVRDWTQDNASYFRAIRIEKTMMSIILLLIVAVAAFNLVAMLVMVVTDKRTDIAILRTLGAAPRRVLGIFITQGLVIGWLGVAAGIAVGLTVALNVSSIVPFLQGTFGFEIMDPDVYYNTLIPSEVHAGNIVIITLAALAMTGLAVIYPAIRASRTAPAEALRYE